jgi:type I restriction enzyme, R subunit
LDELTPALPTDGPDWQKHIRSRYARRKLANRFKDAKNPFNIVIVRDM